MDSCQSAGKLDLNRLTLVDVIAIVLLLLLSTSVILHNKLGSNLPWARVAEASIFRDGELLFQHLKLDKDQEVVLSNGAMVVEVKDGRVRVKDSDCPRRICLHTGWIQHPGETIVCVPNKIVIEIEASGSAPSVDAVAS
ncbi:MAG: NusG domain II-containing protein [Nitrospirota bacterium]